jgi:hypothetical protein
MRSVRVLLVLCVVLATAGCYHAIVDTGREAAPERIEKKWAHGWLWGLVPPSEVESAETCPRGVARVETKHSFLNMVANAVTGGIYTPMTIEVQCAAE